MQVVLWLLFTAITNSICLSENEQEGQCTSCSPLDFLDAGRCYTKIRGCLTNKAGPICIECQSGYILNASICIREALFQNETNSTIPPVTTNNTPTLTPEEISTKLGEYSELFQQASRYFKNKYQILSESTVKNVEVLPTKTNIFLSIEFRINNQSYLAIGYFNQTHNFNEWNFTNATIRNDPIFAHQFITQLFNNELNNFTIYSLNLTNDIYTINYIKNNSDIIKATVNRNQLSVNFTQNVKIQPLTLSDLALEFAIIKYPSLANTSISSVKKYESLYLVELGLKLAMSYEFDNITFKINQPTIGIIGGYNLGTINESIGLEDFVNYTDSKFVAAIQKVSQELPELIGAQITKVKYSNISTLLFYFTLNKIGTIYEIKIASSSTPQVLQAIRNNITILSTNYSYNQDHFFMSNYNVIAKETKILNIPSINSVYYKLNGNIRYFKVIYSNKEYAEFMVSGNGTSWLAGYIIDNKDIRDSLEGIGQTGEKRTIQVLMTFLESKQPFTKGSKVEELTESSEIYTLTIVTKSGKYRTKIHDKGTLNLTEFTLISNETCYNYPHNKLIEDPKLSQINKFLILNYPLLGYNLELIQTKIFDDLSYQHRFLYANGNGTGKQIEIIIQEKNSSINVTKASYLNYNFEPSGILSPDYYTAISLIQSLDLKGSQIPLYVESNNTHIRSYYNDGKSTFEIVYKKGSSDVKNNIVANKEKLVLPDGFDMAFLVIPGNSTAEIDRIIGLIVEEAIKKYPVLVKDSLVIFAEKRSQIYTLLVKNAYGFSRIEANITEKGVITLNRVIITSLKESSFGKCTKFTKTGQCSSCKTNESEYQGDCYNKIEGCHIQAGPYCVKCSGSYVRFGADCFKECSYFFK